MAVGATNLFLMLSSKTHNPPREFGHKPHIIPKWLDSHHFTHFYSSCIALRASSTGFNSHIFVDQQQLATCNCDHKANFENWTWHHALLNSALHLWLWVTSTCSWCWAQKPTTHIEKFGHNPLFTPSNHPALPVNHFVQVQLDSIGYISHISVDHQQLAASVSLWSQSKLWGWTRPSYAIGFSYNGSPILDAELRKPVTGSENLASKSEEVEQSVTNTFEQASRLEVHHSPVIWRQGDTKWASSHPLPSSRRLHPQTPLELGDCICCCFHQCNCDQHGWSKLFPPISTSLCLLQLQVCVGEREYLWAVPEEGWDGEQGEKKGGSGGRGETP